MVRDVSRAILNFCLKGVLLLALWPTLGFSALASWIYGKEEIEHDVLKIIGIVANVLWLGLVLGIFSLIWRAHG